MKKIFLLLMLTLIMPISAHAYYNSFLDSRIYCKAKITDIKTEQIKSEYEDYKLFKTTVFLKMLTGPHKDEILKQEFQGENSQPKEVKYKVGQRIHVSIVNDGQPDFFLMLHEPDNSTTIIVLSIILALCIILIGRTKGFLSLVALALTMLLVFIFFVPAVLKGKPPLPFAVLLCIISTAITLPLIAGFTKKALAAFLGATSGLIFAAILTIIVGNFVHLSGIISPDMLKIFYASNVEIDLKDLALSGMIIAALGAIMDICISIASSTKELYAANPQLSRKEAFKSVLTIGTDILGSMVNTLILAYAGSSLSLILIITMKYDSSMPLSLILSYNPVLTEIVKSIIGSIGMFVCIPLTALFAVNLYFPKNNKNHGETDFYE